MVVEQATLNTVAPTVYQTLLNSIPNMDVFPDFTIVKA